MKRRIKVATRQCSKHIPKFALIDGGQISAVFPPCSSRINSHSNYGSYSSAVIPSVIRNVIVRVRVRVLELGFEIELGFLVPNCRMLLSRMFRI